MRTLFLVAKLCSTNSRAFVVWAALGPLTFLFFGLGGMPGSARGWGGLLIIGLLFGAFIAAIETVNDCREKKNQTLTSLERDIRGLSERSLNLLFAMIGASIGALLALVLDLPPAGYAISAAVLGLLGLGRRHISRILP